MTVHIRSLVKKSKETAQESEAELGKIAPDNILIPGGYGFFPNATTKDLHKR
jgi:hypothetical protein